MEFPIRRLLLAACLGCLLESVPAQALHREPNVQFIVTDNSLCNDGRGCDMESGEYCNEVYRKCMRCSPCPDPYVYYLGPSFWVIDVCVNNGYCPLLCSATLNLGDRTLMNATFCTKQDLHQRTDCELSCANGGTLDNNQCQCSCAEDWSGNDCSECSLTCAHEGALDSSSCTCSCEGEWIGKNCSECGLTSCENGGTLNLTSCQCQCSEDWEGSTCTDCGLPKCENSGYLDESKCCCICKAGWTGTTCSEPVTELPKTGGSTNGNGTTKGTNSHVTEILLSPLIGLLCCAVVIFFFWKKCYPLLKPSREGSWLLGAELTVHPTLDSLDVRATKSGSVGKRPVRILCQAETGSGQRESPTSWSSGVMKWNREGCVSHTFGGLEVGTTYRLALEEKEGATGRWKELQATKATTSYYSLSVVRSQDGRSATVSGLNQGSWNTLMVCLCHLKKLDQCWLDVSPGDGTVQLDRIVATQSYTVRAGVRVGVRAGGQGETFRCFAQGTLDGDPSAPLTETCQVTIGDVLDDVPLVRTLEVEVKGRDSLQKLLGQAFELERDHMLALGRSHYFMDELRSTLAAQGHLDLAIHGMMEVLGSHQEAGAFLWKVARFTKFKCLQCLELLHQSHAHQPESFMSNSPSAILPLQIQVP